MSTVTSKDGTKIAFDKIGSGPAVILVNGATAYRAFDPTMAQLAELLGKQFTVYNYDRRGRGDSGDTQPFAKEREIEDLQALVEDAGGKAMVFGISSGGVLSLDAAAVTPGITKVVVYEPSLIVDDSRQPVPADYAEHLTMLAAEGKRDEAIEYFLTQAVGIPAEYISGMKQDQTTWSRMASVAHTIAYDAAFVGNVMQGKPLPTDRWVKVTVPVLVADGGASDAWLHHAADALSKVLPHASRLTLEGQTHMVDPKVLAPVLIEFFKK
ncbi:MAG: alpha/beta hydrolase [Chloroflexi bacterium]|nr:alpha/beta hydrolase [Chloroflexota bacterium]MCI0578679.1 alpha/beta hydrolase [Chloroflexota bacterium]MCI0643275.1 alpha/beta hydrolase [Chloroflexota bacterium]MCI0728168.1 alpha/beta hydrolase [Chloroflexota bacterium]